MTPLRTFLVAALIAAGCSSTSENTRDPVEKQREARRAHAEWEKSVEPVRHNHETDFHACYHDTAPAERGDRGMVTARIKVTTDGTVEEAKVSAFTDGFADVADCVSQVATSLKFPPPPDDRTLVWSFEFDAATTPEKVVRPEGTTDASREDVHAPGESAAE